jgi:hypothetical protein
MSHEDADVDLVTCSGCKHVFSPTPGQKVRCPACMRFLEVPTASAVRAAPKAVRTAAPTPSTPARRKTVKPAKSSGPVWLLVLLAIALVGGGGFWFATRPRPTDVPEPIAQRPTKPRINLPEVVDPEVPRRAERKSDPNSTPSNPNPAPTLVLPDDPVRPKVTPKARPIEVSAIPDVEVPEFKTKRFEVKKIAGVDPDKINAAIRKGVAFLQRTSPDWGNSNGQWDLGVPALGGLALLECEMPPNSPLMQQVANHVRAHSLNKMDTYELSLAILFLDRLGQPRDRGLIQTMSARLIAGQDSAGGWTYRCPLLTQPETVHLLSILQQNRPAQARPLMPLTIGDGTPAKTIKKVRDPFSDPFADPFAEPVAELDPRRDPKNDGPGPAKTASDVRPTPPKILPRSRMSGQSASPVSAPTPPPLPATGLTQKLQNVPTVRQRDRSRASLELEFKDTYADLSNTQFAVLALWAARRHGVVSDRALILTEQRLRKTQSTSGAWRYQEHRGNEENAALCCCGLLGMALGIAADQPHGASLAKALQTDQVISRGLDYLGDKTGDPLPTYSEVGKVLDLYALWSTERVAMIYHQKTIRGKDWYGWGAQNLLKNQEADGSWLDPNGHSHSAHVDTSLALLFLVRSNLVQEITEQIRLQIPIQER